MSVVVSFLDYTPAPRFDDVPWAEVDIEEATDDDGPWTVIDTIALDPVDADPENPATRSFTTDNGTDVELWYRLIFRDGSANEQQPTLPVQNVAGVTAYATVTELARILKIREPTEAQRNALERVLGAAAGEINSEIDLDDETHLSGWQLQLAAEVNLERAVEHWRQQEAPFGLLGLGVEFGGGTERTARDSWARHANKLAPLKSQWGFA